MCNIKCSKKTRGRFRYYKNASRIIDGEMIEDEPETNDAYLLNVRMLKKLMINCSKQ